MIVLVLSDKGASCLVSKQTAVMDKAHTGRGVPLRLDFVGVLLGTFLLEDVCSPPVS